MVTVEIIDERIWDNLPQFAGGDTDNPEDKNDNLHYICQEYGLNRAELTEDMINELYDYTESDTEVIARIIDKYWIGTYFVEYVDDRNNGYIRAVSIKNER